MTERPSSNGGSSETVEEAERSNEPADSVGTPPPPRRQAAEPTAPEAPSPSPEAGSVPGRSEIHTDEPSTELGFDTRAALLAKLRHQRDDESLLELFLEAQTAFEGGNNRRARERLQSLLDDRPSPELTREARALLKRIRPDPLALMFGLVCLAGLIVVWLLAVRG